jgi:UDP:flavonoid glycosyltransferase YjiC (YdhE family)
VRVLLTCHDAGGTVPPVLGLAQALLARGHEVLVLSQPSVRARAEDLGCRFTPLSTVRDYAPRTPIEEQLDVALPALTGREVGEDVLALAADGVDAVVVDANLAGALSAAESLPQPSAVLLHSMYATFVRTWFADLWPLLGDTINGVRGGFGLAPVGDWAGLFRAHHRLLAVVPAELEAAVPEVPANLRHFGFLLPFPRPGAEAPPFPDGDGPAVLVGLSTTYQAQEALLQSVLDALGLVGARGIVTTAGQVDATAMRVPPSVRVEESVPHALVLPEADVMVTHAGLGSVASALGAGVPLVCAPIARDQPLNTEQVVAAGAGVAVPPTASPEELAAAVREVVGDPAHRRAAEAVAAASRTAGGPAAAAADLESLVAGP